MGTISELLRYKKEVELKNPRTEKVIAKVWVRVLGDEDVKEAYKFSRVKSAEYRALLQDETTPEYKLQVKSLEEQDDKDLYDLIMAARVNDFTRESVAVVAREELPKLEEVSVEPDAPTLKEQEDLDKEEAAVTQRFTDAINKYVQERQTSFEGELSKLSREELIVQAKKEIVEMAPTQAFLEELQNQRGYRGTFRDKECKTKAFETIDEFRNTESAIRQQILEAYGELEMDADEIKN